MSRFKGLGEMMPAQLKDTTMKAGSGGEKEYLRFRTLRGFEKWLRTTRG